MLLVGYGASAAAIAGIRRARSSPTSPRPPPAEGTVAVKALVAAIQTGKVSGAVDPVAGLPRQRHCQQGDVSQFTRGVARLIVPDNDQDILRGVHVELRDIGKSFGGTRALEGVSLTIARGSIHALVGENGAGKSTLGKIIAGAYAPDDGQMLLAASRSGSIRPGTRSTQAST